MTGLSGMIKAKAASDGRRGLRRMPRRGKRMDLAPAP
jgi:hypothetical protein